MATSIGASPSTLTALSAFTTPIPEPTVYYSECSDFIDSNSGGRTGRGSPVIRWSFALLELAAMRNQLKALITGSSGDVSIQCVVQGTEHVDNAKMIWPVPEPANMDGLGIALDLEFRHSVQVS